MKQTSTMKRTADISPALKNRFDAPLAKAANPKADFNQKVAEKAYQLYVARGYANGHDVEDWLKAERIVRGL